MRPTGSIVVALKVKKASLASRIESLLGRISSIRMKGMPSGMWLEEEMKSSATVVDLDLDLLFGLII